MSNFQDAVIAPFGYNDSTKEHDVLSDLYLAESDFDTKALSGLTNVIIGRRGSGKSALAWWLSHNRTKTYDFHVQIDEARIFTQVSSELARAMELSSYNVVEDVADIWSLALWASLLTELSKLPDFDKAPVVRQFLERYGDPFAHSHLIVAAILRRITEVAKEGSLLSLLAQVQSIEMSSEFANAKNAAREYFASGKRALLVIDTMEVYEIRELPLQRAMAGLLHAVAALSKSGIHKNVDIKCFIPAELVPFMMDSTIANIGKDFDFPLFMHWRPRTLVRMLSRRFHHYLLEAMPSEQAHIGRVDWTDYDDVKQKVWDRYFPSTVINRSLELEEESSTYILRHSQLQPRQVISLCNKIAQAAHEDRTFPIMHPKHVTNGVQWAEQDLAQEVIAAYRTLYPNCGPILSVFNREPYVFMGNHLDHLAPQSGNSWTSQVSYDRNLFWQMVAELGVIGRVEDYDNPARDHQRKPRYLKARFEFALNSRLVFDEKDQLAIHPMFYERFQTTVNFPSSPKQAILPIGVDINEES